jgi:hypothetical protein
MCADCKYSAAWRELRHAGEKLARLLTKQNFNPDQPRVSAGNPDGGQWTRLAGSTQKDKCIDQCYRLLERRQPLGTSQLNAWAFQRCVNACLGMKA